MEVANIKKRMADGADEGIERCLTKSQENNLLEKLARQVEPNAAEDSIQAKHNETDTPNNIRGQIWSEAYLSSGSLEGVEISTTERRRSDGPVCFCPSMLNPGKPNAGKFDEMIEYAFKNLNEAEKGLNNLGDNFEHDLRLMFMDIMGRVQHWVSVVQNRIHAARADVESLKKESVARVSDLTARDLELVELRRRLNEAETKLAVKIAQEHERLVTANPEVASEFPGQGSLAQGKEKVSTSVQTILNSKNAATSSMNTVCNSVKNSEKTARETELEAEIAELREKNESMIKDREEYENAIQCALLRGVSSLNLEAFKVLRRPPPTGCWDPCVFSSENYSLRRPSSRAAPQPAQRRSSAIPKNMEIHDEDDEDDGIRGRNGEETKSCLSCSNDEGNKRPVENNVQILLLHHGDAAAKNFHCIRPCTVLQPLQPQPIINGNMDSKEASVCVGGKCKKTAAIKTPRVQKSPAMSRLESCDFFVRNRDDPASEKIHTKKNNSPTIGKRCNVCLNKNNRK